MALTRDYEESLSEDLADPEEAAGYLSACLEEGPDEFLLGLRDVAKAQGGMSKLAGDTELARESLYRMLSEEGNPTFASISAVLHSLGIQLQFVPAQHGES